MEKIFTCFILFWINMTSTVFSQVPTYLPANGLVAWYPFNGNANDESGNGHNGIIYGALSLISDRKGIYNSAYSWPTNGNSGNYIDIGNITSSIPNNITISVWIYMDGGVYDARIVSVGEGGLIINGAPSNTSRTLKASYDLAGAQVWPSTFSINAKSWHHVVFTGNYQTQTGKLYVNGILTDTKCCGTVGSVPNSNWNIGRKSIASFDGWGGYIDDIGIWNRVLTDLEIAQLYNTTLPLQLLNFSTNAQNNNVVLNWQTANEVNFSHFDIEYSVDGLAFTRLVYVIGNNSNNYSFIHLAPSSATNYYRLKMIEKDGSYTYSPIKEIQLIKSIKLVSVYPNPITNQSIICINISKVSKATIVITDYVGKVISKQEKELAQGNNSFTINSTIFISGIYQLTVTTNETTQSFKIIKQ